MADGKYYVERAAELIADSPRLSHALESFRAYAWEIHIPRFAGALSNVPGMNDQSRLTLAAKQITQPGFTVEDIEVHRVNEKFYYPGKPSPDEITVTFDNLKRTVTIWQLDAHRNPVTHVNLYGCYPKGWKLGEFNYSTNDFHTIEMTLRYDFAVQFTETSDIDSVMSPIAV